MTGVNPRGINLGRVRPPQCGVQGLCKSVHFGAFGVVFRGAEKILSPHYYFIGAPPPPAIDASAWDSAKIVKSYACIFINVGNKLKCTLTQY